MKNILLKTLVLIFLAGIITCATYKQSPKVHFIHGEKIPDKFITLIDFMPEEIEFQIRAKFIQRKLYHIILDEEETRLSEGWFSTAKFFGTSSYTVRMKAKKGFNFQPGSMYRLCIGEQNPDHIYKYTSNYQCLVYYEFILPEK